MALTKASIGNLIAAIALAEILRVVRLVRGLVLTLREQAFVEAAVASGRSLPRILLRHILPNTTAPNFARWGNIMAEGRSLFQIAPDT